MKTITIAIVENVTVFREGYCRFVQDSGFQLLLAALDEEEMITHLKLKEIPDICISSIELFQSNNGLFFKQLKVCCPDIKLMAYSKYDIPDCNTIAANLGIDALIKVTEGREEFYKSILELSKNVPVTTA